MSTLLQKCSKQTFYKTVSTLVRGKKTKCSANITMTDDSSVVVCWHPEESYPYEMSQPIKEKKKIVSNSLLKVQSNKELLSVLKPKRKDLVRQELMALTHSQKHVWFPPKFQFRKKQQPEKDRPYL